MQITDFKALTFDSYGTLIDWETGMFEALKPLAARARQTLTRDAVLAAHGRHESAQQQVTPAMPYSRLLAMVYKRLAEEWGVPAPFEEALAYGRSIRDWPAFPDSAEALKYLKQHYRLVILSNVDNESFAFSNQKLGVTFDAIYTAEDIGSYKPSPRNFTYMFDKLDTLGLAKADILHTAESLFHDHGPANEFGLKSCWIHRRHAEGGSGATMPMEKPPHYDFRFTSMKAFADEHRRLTGGN